MGGDDGEVDPLPDPPPHETININEVKYILIRFMLIEIVFYRLATIRLITIQNLNVTFTSHNIDDTFALHYFILGGFMALELLAVGTGYVAILMPVLLIWVIFSYSRKTDKDKYDAMVDISKNLENETDIKALLESFKEEKKPIDYKRNGVIVIFIGLGLFLFGTASDIGILKGVGLLVGTIGIGTLIAGYLYPNDGAGLTNAVEKFEE